MTVAFPDHNAANDPVEVVDDDVVCRLPHLTRRLCPRAILIRQPVPLVDS